jgi:fluoroquinolone resistance protein
LHLELVKNIKQLMNREFIDSKEFKNVNFTNKVLAKGDYEYCHFINCDLSDTDLSEISFLECEFDNCNLSLVKLHGTTFRELIFTNCKLLGLQFENCSQYFFSAQFLNCTLIVSSFYKRDLKNIKFSRCNLNKVDFTEAEMTGLSFDDCDLNEAIFENSNLNKANFTTAKNYTLDPEKNSIEQAKFSILGLEGLLTKYNISIT